MAREIEKATGMKTRGVVAVSNKGPEEPPQPDADDRKALDDAKSAFQELKLERAERLAEKAESGCLEKLNAELCRELIFEARMLKGMAAEALGQKEAAAKAFRSAHAVDPSRVLDPRKYPPRTISSFMSACAAGERAGSAAVELASKPIGASFDVNGRPVDARKVNLTPAAHIIEASLSGYEPARTVLEIGMDSKGPGKITVPLKSLPDLGAWEDMRAGLSAPSLNLTEAGLSGLLRRFDITYVVLLEKSETAGGFEASLGAPEARNLESLPAIGLPGEPVSDEFVESLKEALGIAPQPEQATAPVPEVAVEDETDEDDESSLTRIRTEDADESATDSENMRKVIRSPWFWGSLGVVAAVVAGVAIASAVD